METKLYTIEEAAGLIYTDLKIQKHQENAEDITMEEIVEKLQEQDYKIETRQADANSVKGISLAQKEVTLEPNENITLKVNIDKTESKNLYYVVLEDKYYEINLTNARVVIDREEKKLDENVENANLEIEQDYDKDVITNAKASEDTIIFTAGTKGGNTTLTVKYGKCSDTCEVTVKKELTSITANSMTIKEGEEKKIKLILNPSDATAVLKYITNTAQLVVNNEGIVSIASGAKIKVKDAGTITIKDEQTGLTATCNVTIDTMVGTFIEYDVSYTDVLNNYAYTKSNGWRLLNYTKNSDGTYSNVELISTGVPALIDYEYDQGNNSWWVTNATKLQEFRSKLRLE